MNSTLLGRLLVLNKGIRVPGKTSSPTAPTEGRRLSPLRSIKPVCLTPVQPLLSVESGSAPRDRPRGKLGAAVLGGSLAVGLVTVASFLVFGMERVHHAREHYQLSLQLRQKERELHQVQQAYHALEAFVAVQAARDIQEAQVQRVSMTVMAPAKPAPRVTPVQYHPVKRRVPLCSKRSNTGV